VGVPQVIWIGSGSLLLASLCAGHPAHE